MTDRRRCYVDDHRDDQEDDYENDDSKVCDPLAELVKELSVVEAEMEELQKRKKTILEKMKRIISAATDEGLHRQTAGHQRHQYDDESHVRAIIAHVFFSPY